MIPAARLAAAIDLVDAIQSSGKAADRVLTGWFRARRYAGSKDRRAITELVYATLRERGALGFRLHTESPSARLLVMLASGIPLDQLSTMMTGEGFAPAPPDDAERASLAAALPTDAEMPGWARHNHPAWLEPLLRARFGDAYDAEMTGLSGRAPLDLRVNTLKADRETVLAKLAETGIAAAPTPLSPLGLRLGHERLADHPLLREGWVEVQDDAAQIAAMLVQAGPGMRVVDYCAGAGGKTLALAAQMKNQGRLHAFDTDERRLGRMVARLDRAGITNVRTKRLSPAVLPELAELQGGADRVLLDVPCSGSGTWRRNPEARWRLTPETLAEFARVQAGLLVEAAPLVKPGGRLVYVTCSVLEQEDEAVLSAFLAAHPGFTALPLSTLWREAPAHQGPGLLLTPARQGCDGFFVAVLERTA